MPAGAKRLDRLRGVEEHRRGHIDGVDRPILECRSQVAENLGSVGLGLGRVSGEDTVEAAPRLSQDGWDHALGCDVANSNHQPIQHRALYYGGRGTPSKQVVPKRSAFVAGFSVAGLPEWAAPPAAQDARTASFGSGASIIMRAWAPIRSRIFRFP